MLLSALTSLALAVSALAGGPYPVKEKLHCRSGTDTSSKIVKDYPAGTKINLSCYQRGQSIGGNTIWDKTSDGCFVSDYYVTTGSTNPVVKACTTGGGGGTTSPCASINDDGVALIKKFEGFYKNPYKDPVGLWTVGYGHLCANGGKDSSCSGTGFKYPLTEATATELLKKDLPNYTKCFPKYLTSGAKLNKNQYAALTSFTFNLGCGVLKDFAGRLNKGEDANTVFAQEFPKYVHAGGKVLPGLVTRRKEEVALAKKAGSTEAWPKCAK